jgi:acetyl-CoA C-acetyltransferase
MAFTFSNDDIVIVEATRSIIGAVGGGLKDLSAAQLAIPVVESLLAKIEKRSRKFSREDVDYFVAGLSIGAGIGQNLPRQIAHKTGMNEIKSAFAVNEMCGSGMEAIILGVHPLRLGEAKIALVGGVESPSMSPWLITTEQLIGWKDEKVFDIQEKVVRADMYDALWDRMFDVHTIYHAENTTREWVEGQGLDAEAFKRQVDDYAKMSHDRALAAIERGDFKEEITVIPGTGERDELPAKKNIKIMYKRKGTQFTPDGVFLSNHNSPPLGDCAAFMVLMKGETAADLGLTPLARIIGYDKAGVVPEQYLLGAQIAARRLLETTGTSVDDYDLMESNTAFGPQMLINKTELGLDLEKVNIRGDCIALGHPIGAAGARILTTLMHSLKQKDKKRGMAFICLGGGNGIAMAVERP